MPKTGVPNPTQSMAASKLPSKEAVRPWEDGSLSAEVRFESYKEVVKAKVEAILEALQREGITDAEKFKLMHEPDTQFWSQEIKQVNSETAEQFCERMDREVIPKLLGKNFLGPDQWQQGFQVDVGVVPPIPKSITKELLESECPLHPGEKIKDTHMRLG